MADVLPFDRVCVIALPERRAPVLDVLARAGIHPDVFPAVLKGGLDIAELVEQGYVARDAAGRLGAGRIACHLSHIGVLERFLRDPAAQTCLVFEDDLQPPPADVVANTWKVWDVLPAGWDILYLGRCYDHCTQDVAAGPGVVRCFSPLCRHAYAVTRAGAQVLVDHAFPLGRPGDTVYRALIRGDTLVAYCASPALFFQNREKFGTTLGNFGVLRECARFHGTTKIFVWLAVLLALLASVARLTRQAFRRKPR